MAEETQDKGPGATEDISVDRAAEIFREKGLAKSFGFEASVADRPETADDAPEPGPNAATEGEESPDPEAAAPETPAPEPEAPPQPRKFKVKHDGVEREVTEDELIRGYRREQDWQEKRRALDAEKAEIAQKSQHYAQQLQYLVPALQQQIAGEFADIKTMADVQTLARENPQRFNEWQAKQLTIQTAQAELERVNRDKETEQKAQWTKRLNEESERLGEKIPEFKDPAKRPVFMDRLKSYLRTEIGYTDAEIDRAADHRDIVVAEKARLWDEAQKAKAKAKTVDVPTPVKPGRATAPAGRGEELNSARGALRKSGSVRAFADVLKSRGIN